MVSLSFTARLLATCSWLGLSVFLSAQEKQSIECRFIALDQKPAPLVNKADEGQETPIEVLSSQISKPINCVAIDGRLSFLDKNTGKPVASLAVPKKLKKAILVFIKNPKKEGEDWKIFPFENTPEAYPPGGARVINLHGSEIRVLLGKKGKTLKRFESAPFTRPEERDKFNMARVTFQFKNKKEEWVTVENTGYRFVPPRRFLIFAYLDPNTKRPRVKSLGDIPPPAEPPVE